MTGLFSEAIICGLEYKISKMANDNTCHELMTPELLERIKVFCDDQLIRFFNDYGDPNLIYNVEWGFDVFCELPPELGILNIKLNDSSIEKIRNTSPQRYLYIFLLESFK